MNSTTLLLGGVVALALLSRGSTPAPQAPYPQPTPQNQPPPRAYTDPAYNYGAGFPPGGTPGGTSVAQDVASYAQAASTLVHAGIDAYQAYSDNQ